MRTMIIGGSARPQVAPSTASSATACGMTPRLGDDRDEPDRNPGPGEAPPRTLSATRPARAPRQPGLRRRRSSRPATSPRHGTRPPLRRTDHGRARRSAAPGSAALPALGNEGDGKFTARRAGSRPATSVDHRRRGLPPASPDRSKDVIKSGGEWINSVQLENAIMSHPAVLEAAVFAARHPKWDERPVAAVCSRRGADRHRRGSWAHTSRAASPSSGYPTTTCS